MGKFVRMTLLGAMLLILMTATTSHAALTILTVPEIDPTSAIAPAALLTGAVLVIRGRIKR